MRSNLLKAGLAVVVLLIVQSSAMSQVARPEPAQPAPAGQQGKLPWDPPLASVPPMLQVFKSSDGSLYRTQVARVVGHTLTEGELPILTLTLDTRLPAADVIALGTQLKSRASYDKMEFGSNTFTPMGLKKWSVEVQDVSGERIGYMLEDGGAGYAGLPEKLSIKMTRPVKATEMGSCKVRISLSYMFDGITINKATVHSASKAFSGVVEQLYSPGMVAENDKEVWKNWRPRPGNYVSRESTQRLKAIFSSRVIFTNYGLQKSPELDVLVQAFKQMVETVVTEPQDVAIKAQENYFIFTPGLGRLEIKPTTGTFKDFQKSSEEAFASSFKKVMEHEHKFALSAMEFAKWYNSKNSSSSSSGSDSNDFSSLSKYGQFGIDTDSDYSFSTTLNELKGGERSSYLSLYNFLTDKQKVDTSVSKTSAQKWVGENVVEGGAPNTVSLNKLSDTYQQVDKEIEAVLVRFTGAVPVPYSRIDALTQPVLPALIDFKVTPAQGRTFHAVVSFTDPKVHPVSLTNPIGVMGISDSGEYRITFVTYNAKNELVHKTSSVIPLNALQFEVKDFYKHDGTNFGKRTGTMIGHYIMWDFDHLWYDGPVTSK